MRRHFRRVAAGIVALAFLLTQAGAMGSTHLHSGSMTAVAQQPGHVVTTPPVRIEVKEPARTRPTIRPPSAIRPKLVVVVQPPKGVRVVGPPMLLPSEIDGVLKTTAHRRAPVCRCLQHAIYL